VVRHARTRGTDRRTRPDRSIPDGAAPFPATTLHRNSELVDLIVSNGAVVGAVVRRNDEQVRIRARRGVLLAAGGGFSHADGRPLAYNSGDVRQVGCLIASHGPAHAEVCRRARLALAKIERI
jgi:hypothetical protein